MLLIILTRNRSDRYT